MTTATVAEKNGKAVLEPAEKFEPRLYMTTIHTQHEQKHLLEELRRIGAPIACIVIAVSTPEQEAMIDDSLFDWGGWSHDEVEAEYRYIDHELAV